MSFHNFLWVKLVGDVGKLIVHRVFIVFPHFPQEYPQGEPLEGLGYFVFST